MSTYSEKLAKFFYFAVIISLVSVICWYFRSTLIYIVLAAVVALMSRPIYKFLMRIRVKKFHFPDWLASLLSMLVVAVCFMCIIFLVFPVVGGVASDISSANVNNLASSAREPLVRINEKIRELFPFLVNSDFRIESFFIDRFSEWTSGSSASITSIVGSLASFTANFFVAVFAIFFISFFFIKSPGIFSSFIIAFIPDKFDEMVRESLKKISNLISRYLIGITLEVIGVSLINFLGLWAIAKMGFGYSIGIAFMTGVLNLIPYLGPLLGIVLGTSLSLTIKYICVTSYGLGVGFISFVLILLGIFIFTQLIDVYVFQPVIYSTSVKVHPLEIFIVFLLAATMAGPVGMLVAIPAYTVVRVIAKQFFPKWKPIRMLTKNDKE